MQLEIYRAFIDTLAAHADAQQGQAQLMAPQGENAGPGPHPVAMPGIAPQPVPQAAE
jgi:hypothetical protein